MQKFKVTENKHQEGATVLITGNERIKWEPDNKESLGTYRRNLCKSFRDVEFTIANLLKYH